MALTPEQIKKLQEKRSDFTQPSQTQGRSGLTIDQLLQRKQEKDKTKSTFLSRVKENLGQRGQQIKDVFTETARGEINPAETGIRFVGNVAGSIGDVAGAALSPLVQSVAEKEWAKPAFEALGRGMETYEEWKNSSEGNRRAGEIIESVVNITDLVGAGAAGKSLVKTAGKTAGKTAARAVEDVGSAVSKVGSRLSAVKEVAEDVIPTKGEIVSGQIARSLDLTPGDIANLKNSTGNDIGEFMTKNNLVKNTKDETLESVQKFFDTNYRSVRDNIQSVKKTYTPTEFPRYTQSLQKIKESIKDVPGLEADNAVVDELLSKKTISLGDVQTAKELLDDHFALYKTTGDPAQGTVKEGIRKIREELRTFIENEVKDSTGANIRAMNNNVATSKGIIQNTIKREARDLTRADISLYDIGFFGVGSFVSPLTGAALVFGKKVLQSPAIRLRFVQWLNSLPELKKTKVMEQFNSGIIPKEVPASIKKLTDLIPETAGAVTGAGTVDAIKESVE